jgi:hypothetical protein
MTARRTRELKVYGGPMFVLGHGQCRTVAMVATKAELIEVLNKAGGRVNARIVRDYWAETGNDEELAAAKAAGAGVVLANLSGRWHGDYQVVKDE